MLAQATALRRLIAENRGVQVVHFAGQRVGIEIILQQAARRARFFSRFIERRQKQRQKRHVIRQCQRWNRPIAVEQRTAKAAVNTLVTRPLRLIQPRKVGNHISEHSGFSFFFFQSNSAWFRSAP